MGHVFDTDAFHGESSCMLPNVHLPGTCMSSVSAAEVAMDLSFIHRPILDVLDGPVASVKVTAQLNRTGPNPR